MPSILVDGLPIEVADDDPRLPQPGPVEPVVPDEVDRRQGRLALYGAGLLDKVEALVAQADPPVRIWYADALTWKRSNPVFLAVAGLLDPPLSSAAIDDLFVKAAAL